MPSPLVSSSACSVVKVSGRVVTTCSRLGRPSERMRRVRPGAKGFARDEAEFSGTIVRKVASSGEAIAVSDIAEEDDLREQRSVVALGLRQIMCAPMRARGRVIGIVYIDSRRLAFEEHGGDATAALQTFDGEEQVDRTLSGASCLERAPRSLNSTQRRRHWMRNQVNVCGSRATSMSTE